MNSTSNVGFGVSISNKLLSEAFQDSDIVFAVALKCQNPYVTLKIY